MPLERLQFLRGDENENDQFTGYDGEITVDKTHKGVRIHDGSEAGGAMVVPERMTRANDVSGLQSVNPSENRFVVVDGKNSQFDGFGGLAVWDAQGTAANANGETKIASTVNGYQSGDPREGVWVVIIGLLEELSDSGQARFDGDGSRTIFRTSHGIGVTPDSWRVTPATDDASGFSHAEADHQDITFYYDYAPPSGSQNVILNWAAEREGTVTDIEAQYETAIFDSDGSTLQFCIPHGLNGVPGMWQVEALNNDTSGISHVTANSVNLCVKYDSPPPAGNQNVAFNWSADPGTFNKSSVEDGGKEFLSGDGSKTTFKISHNLGANPEFGVLSPITDDASGISFISRDSSEITVHYDTPPTSGSDNIQISWYVGSTDYSSVSDYGAGEASFSGDGTTDQFKISHGLPSVPTNAIVTPGSNSASGISHISYDASEVNVIYDSAPASGANVDIHWFATTA